MCPAATRPMPQSTALRTNSGGGGDCPHAACAGIRCARRSNVIAQIDASLPVQIEPLRESAGRLSVRPRFNALLLAVFAALGFLLSASGIYGVLGFLVAQRTREIGLRIALGATPQAMVAMVLANALRWLAAGLFLGWPSRWLFHAR